MGSRILPLMLAIAALAAGGAGADGAAAVLVLIAIPCAAAAAFVAISDVLEGRPEKLRAVTTALALALMVIGSTVRTSAPLGGAVPALAVSTLVAAVVLYGLPAFVWVLEPLVRPRHSAQRVRVAPDA
jgi:hypothetical protein